MNDLHEKKGQQHDGSKLTERDQHAASQLYYKKLGTYLLLGYQAYLQKETLLEPEIKASIWRMVQFQEDFPMKIRILQLDYLSLETDTIEGDWDAVKDSLFPVKDDEVLESLSEERQKQIHDYKAEILALLKSK